MNLPVLAAPHPVSVYVLHVLAGLGILATGMLALMAEKGSKRHILAGRSFVVLSLIAGLTALLFMADIGFVPNIFGTSALAITVALSSFLALRKPTTGVRALEAVSLLGTAAVAGVLSMRFIEFSAQGAVPAAFTFACAFFPVFFLVYDAYFVTRNAQQRQAMRLKRHVCGMGFMCALMVHAPVVSVFAEVEINFFLKFFTPYLIWPAIYFAWTRGHNRQPNTLEFAA